MPVQVLRYIRQCASQMACNTPLYNWSLSGDVPDRFLIKPVDLWVGDIEAGRTICEGVLGFRGATIEMGEDCWVEELPPSAHDAWAAHLHGFVWLRDLRALVVERGAGAIARHHAKMMIQSWCEYHAQWDALSWRADITGQRLSMWLSAYEFFSAIEFIEREDEDYFQELFFDSVMRQARHLSRCLGSDSTSVLHSVGAFHAAKGLLYAGVAFEGCEAWVEEALTRINLEIGRQILEDGGHCSRSPAQLLEVLQILLDVRMVLRSADRMLPEGIQSAIEQMGMALRFFKAPDKHLCLFHGAQEGDEDVIESVLRQVGGRIKAVERLSDSGYACMRLGRSHVMMDCGGVPAWPYDKAAHAAPLAFEMNIGKERLFVNCGTHPLDAAWADALRATPAHNTVSLNDRNACEIKGNGHFGRKVSHCDVLREEPDGAVFVQGSHDGYASLNGFTHTRRLYLSNDGEDLRGEDILNAEYAPSKGVDVAVRFHLHPKVMVSLISGGDAALIRMPSGAGWRFSHSGGYLALEDSVYMGQGCSARKTKQLVIYGHVSNVEGRIKWAVQKEG